MNDEDKIILDSVLDYLESLASILEENCMYEELEDLTQIVIRQLKEYRDES